MDANLQDVMSLVSERLGLDIPAELIPSDSIIAPMTRSGDLVFSRVAAPANQEPFLTQGSIDHFINTAPVGYFALGFWGHGINSYAFYYQSVSSWGRIFLRLPWGGALMNDDECATAIGRYLPALVEFIRFVDQRGMRQIIAMESMGVAEYLIRMGDGENVSSAEPLIDSLDPLGRLVSLMARSAQSETVMRIYLDDESGYRRWLEEHPLGLVVNAHRVPKANYMMIHRSDCGTISSPGRIYTSGQYLKACAIVVTDYIDWQNSLEAALEECGICHPLKDLDIEGRRMH